MDKPTLWDSVKNDREKAITHSLGYSEAINDALSLIKNTEDYLRVANALNAKSNQRLQEFNNA